MAKKEKIITVRNRLLGAFESASRQRVDPYIERVEVTLSDIVCEAGGILNHAYFPDGAVLSLLTVLENGTAIETANFGHEGEFGLFNVQPKLIQSKSCAAGGRPASRSDQGFAIGIRA